MVTKYNLQASGWLSVRRLRAHGLVLALCLWGVYAWDMSSPGLHDRNGLLKGTDFLHFYTIGTLAREHRGDLLYNMGAQAVMAPQLAPEAERIVYLPLYGPQVSLLYRPLASLPYGTALAVWLAFTAVLYAGCCYAVWKRCPKLRAHGLTVAIVALGYPAFFHLIAWGQNSALALLCFTLSYLALAGRRPWQAGLAMGLLVYKPSLLFGPVLVLLLVLEWKILLGVVVSSVAELSVGWLYFGTRVFGDYAQQVLRVGSLMPLLEPRPYQMQSLRAFWSLLVPWHQAALALYAISTMSVVVVTARLWRERNELGVRYAALLFAAVLVSPHLTVYDLVVLAPAFLLLAEWLAENWVKQRSGALGALLYLVFVLPLAGRLAAWTHVQVSVIAMCAVLAYLTAKAARGVERWEAPVNATALRT
jgi:hypothetical protein